MKTLNKIQEKTLNAVIKTAKECFDYFDEKEIVICKNGIRYEGWCYGEPANVVCVYGEEPYINYYEEDENLNDKLVDFTDEEINAEKAMEEKQMKKQNTNIILKAIWKSFCREGIMALITVITIITMICGITGKNNPYEALQYACCWVNRMSILVTDADAHIMDVPEIEQLSKEYGTSTPIVIATEKGLAYSPTILGDYNNGVIYVSLKKTIKYQNKKMYNLHDVLRHEWRHHWQYEKYPELSQFWSRIEHTLGKTGTQQVNDAYFGNPIEVDARQFSIGNVSDDSILKEIEISDTVNKKEIAYQCHLLKSMYEE